MRVNFLPTIQKNLEKLCNLSELKTSAPNDYHWLTTLSRILRFLVVVCVFLCPFWLQSTKPLNLERALSSENTIIDSDRLPFSIEVFR